MAKDKIIERPNFELAVMDMDIAEVSDLIASNVGPEGMTQFDLTRAINPQGENVEWKIPGIEEKPEMTDTIEGVIVYHRLVRAYYETEYKGGGVPPSCASSNALQGEGNPGGDCLSCPLAKFGSGKNEGKACREIKQLYILRNGELLPTLVNISSVNVRRPKKYLLDLLSIKRLKFYQVVTKISLHPDKSSGGYDYARTDFSVSSVLSPEAQAAAHEMHKIFAPMLQAQSVVEIGEEAEISRQAAADGQGEDVPY